MRYILLSFLFLAIAFTGHAQIGYQVALLDPTTGEPRINEAVSVTIDITDSEGTVIISDTQTATSNEFGILSLQIGKANSFATMDWSKLPLWVSATVNGTVIGKSQILNIPVAEYAKTTGVLTTDILTSKTWKGNRNLTFNKDGTGHCVSTFTYTIDGNNVLIKYNSDNYSTGGLLQYSADSKMLYGYILSYKGVWK